MKDLRKALRRYAYSAQYLQALSQDDCMRHEINGESVALVSDEDRAHARQSYLIVSARRLKRG
ncbi:ProQ/FINO family protein [Agrobacterium sp. MS2]|uniref:ProQ/FINO family protein n=1 Tax=Agrobacterium sp. MS2 TaxID=1345498 RepID=UPI003365A5FA